MCLRVSGAVAPSAPDKPVSPDISRQTVPFSLGCDQSKPQSPDTDLTYDVSVDSFSGHNREGHLIVQFAAGTTLRKWENTELMSPSTGGSSPCAATVAAGSFRPEAVNTATTVSLARI